MVSSSGISSNNNNITVTHSPSTASSKFGWSFTVLVAFSGSLHFVTGCVLVSSSLPQMAICCPGSGRARNRRIVDRVCVECSQLATFCFLFADRRVKFRTSRKVLMPMFSYCLWRHVARHKCLIWFFCLLLRRCVNTRFVVRLKRSSSKLHVEKHLFSNNFPLPTHNEMNHTRCEQDPLKILLFVVREHYLGHSRARTHSHRRAPTGSMRWSLTDRRSVQRSEAEKR